MTHHIGMSAQRSHLYRLSSADSTTTSASASQLANRFRSSTVPASTITYRNPMWARSGDPASSTRSTSAARGSSLRTTSSPTRTRSFVTTRRPGTAKNRCAGSSTARCPFHPNLRYDSNGSTSTSPAPGSSRNTSRASYHDRGYATASSAPRHPHAIVGNTATGTTTRAATHRPPADDPTRCFARPSTSTGRSRTAAAASNPSPTAAINATGATYCCATRHTANPPQTPTSHSCTARPAPGTPTEPTTTPPTPATASPFR